MKLYELTIISEIFLEENISRLCYEEYKSSFRVEYEDEYVKIMLYSTNKDFSNLKFRIDTFINDYFNKNLNIQFLVKEIIDRDWNKTWKDEFQPIEFKNKIVIQPYFKEYNGTIKNKILLNPSIGFGSGEHPTTKLMINKLIDTNLINKSILDIGSGSGILSLVSLKLGSSKTIMIEIDADAGKNSIENFELNKLNNKCNLLIGDFADETIREKINNKFDIILINILPNIIINLLPYVQEYMNDNSILILSGIINERINDVKNFILKNNFIINNTDYLENWIRLDCKLNNR